MDENAGMMESSEINHIDFLIETIKRYSYNEIK